ncbi:MAG: hypothetical protein IJW47_00945 [Clostridia bacterium]|nr:hypothetical protein [Clostridia bacterium]
MSDSLEYAKMTEIPVSSCEITVQPEGKKDVKKKVINKVNTKLSSGAKKQKRGWHFKKNTADKKEASVKGFNVIHAQVIAIFVLVISILLTNIFWEDSGINVFLRGVFNKEQTVSVEYTDFDPVSPFADREVSLTDGYITASGEGAVYAPTTGEVTALVQNSDGVWEMTINHSDTFKTVISGLTFPYYEVGYSVYSTSPIGYSDGAAAITVGMYDEDVLITDYTIESGNIVWG